MEVNVVCNMGRDMVQRMALNAWRMWAKVNAKVKVKVNVMVMIAWLVNMRRMTSARMVKVVALWKKVEMAMAVGVGWMAERTMKIT